MENITLSELMEQQNRHDVDTGWQGTVTGKKIKILEILEEQISLEDIAHSLSLQCRYNGHCDRFYSVAEHSVYVSLFCNPEDAKWGLLHDATEAYVGDMIRPVKNLSGMELYKEIEDAVMVIIAKRFGLEGPMPDSVKLTDNRVLMTEYDQICTRHHPWDFGEEVERVPVKIACMPPKAANKFFINRFVELFGDSNEDFMKEVW